ASRYMLNKESLNQLVSDLLANRGKSIISAGSTLPESTQIAVNMLNDALGNTALYSFDNIIEGATSAPVPTTTAAGETQTEETTTTPAPTTTQQTTGNDFIMVNNRAS